MSIVKKIEEDQIFNLRTHQVFSSDFQHVYNQCRTRLINEGEKSLSTLKEQLDILDQLSEFPLGRFIIENKGMNGYWTDYTLRPPQNTALKPLEKFYLEKAPSTLATRESFYISQEIMQQNLKNGIKIASLPCGVMANILTLDFSKIENMRLVGIDLDFEVLIYANKLAEERKLQNHLELLQHDAWQFESQSEYDMVSSHGLNLYITNEEELLSLYTKCCTALKPGGLFIGSFLTPSPFDSENSPWDMTKVNEEDLRYQRVIFNDVAKVKWRHFYTYDQVADQLTKAGFADIEFIPDSANIRPVIVAQKG
ncbi:MAG: class I SAM-dependent methyltransferase [Alphaproteobacteria bacterium]|nr:class I SAM-dependent methyltransferase [Alphaproteobacteria bacterium]